MGSGWALRWVEGAEYVKNRAGIRQGTESGRIKICLLIR